MAFVRLVEDKELPYDYKIAGSVSQAEDILNSEKFDVIIVDYLLGDGTAFDIWDLLAGTPTILATGIGDEELAVKAMKAGAYDYLIKDHNRNYLKILPETIESVISRKNTEDDCSNLEHLVDQRTAEIIETRDVTVFALAKLTESRDPETGEHLERLRTYSQILGEQLAEQGPYTDEIDKQFLDDL